MLHKIQRSGSRRWGLVVGKDDVHSWVLLRVQDGGDWNTEIGCWTPEICADVRFNKSSDVHFVSNWGRGGRTCRAEVGEDGLRANFGIEG